MLVLIKNPESAASVTETRPSHNAFDSEMRLRPEKVVLKPRLVLNITTLGIMGKRVLLFRDNEIIIL